MKTKYWTMTRTFHPLKKYCKITNPPKGAGMRQPKQRIKLKTKTKIKWKTKSKKPQCKS
jgi:hypothetical protein